VVYVNLRPFRLSSRQVYEEMYMEIDIHMVYKRGKMAESVTSVQ